MGIGPRLRIYPDIDTHIGGGLSFGLDITPHFSLGAKASYLQGLRGGGIADIMGLIRIYINLFPTNHPVIQADLGTSILFEQGMGAIQEFSSGASFGWRFLFPRRTNHTQEWFIEPSIRVGLPHFERPVSIGINTMAGLRWRAIALREVRQAEREIAAREAALAAERETEAREIAAREAAVREIAEAAAREVIATTETIDAAAQEAVIREIAEAVTRLAAETVGVTAQEAIIREIAEAAAREAAAIGIAETAVREAAISEAIEVAVREAAAEQEAITERERVAIEQERQVITAAHEVTAREEIADVTARRLAAEPEAAAATGQIVAREEITARETAAAARQNIVAEGIGAGTIITRYNYLEQIHASRIFFAANSANFQGLSREILENNNRILQGIAETLNRSANYRLLVIGHANPTTPDSAQRALETRLVPLSIERAQKVVSELVRLGVDRNRLSYIGAGGSMLEIPFNDRANNWRNRRVEFELR